MDQSASRTAGSGGSRLALYTVLSSNERPPRVKLGGSVSFASSQLTPVSGRSAAKLLGPRRANSRQLKKSGPQNQRNAVSS